MIDANEKEVLVKGMKTIWILWSTMFASLGIYIILVNIIGGQIKVQQLSSDGFSLLRNAIYVVSAIELAIIPFIRKSIIKSALYAQTPIQKILGAVNHPAVAKYTSVVHVSVAIAESIAIYGLVLYFLGKDPQSFYMLTAISGIAMIFYRPKMDELEKLAITMREKNEQQKQ